MNSLLSVWKDAYLVEVYRWSGKSRLQLMQSVFAFTGRGKSFSCCRPCRSTSSLARRNLGCSPELATIWLVKQDKCIYPVFRFSWLKLNTVLESEKENNAYFWVILHTQFFPQEIQDTSFLRQGKFQHATRLYPAPRDTMRTAVKCWRRLWQLIGVQNWRTKKSRVGLIHFDV